jgi:D-alanyl-D-alanine dipeptidase
VVHQNTGMRLLCAGLLMATTVIARDAVPPDGFVCLVDHAPGIPVQLHYATERNFVGAPIDGYEAARPILTRPAVQALRRAQSELEAQGLGLKVFDAYRPQRAVHHFIRWAQDEAASATKEQYYPNVAKGRLFAEAYLALESAHSRGSAVDVSLVRRREDGTWQELDLGTPVDFFGPEAHYDFAGLTAEQRANRQLLRTTLEAHGFAAYDREWWHFMLRDEPYPETYFDFPVR